MSSFSQSELEEMSRKELQALAKKHGIRANLKSSVIVDQLLEILKPGAAPTPIEEDKENDAPSPQVTKVVPMTVEKEVPPSPMQKIAQIKCPASPAATQKIVKNAFIALTPHKTPSKTPAKTPAASNGPAKTPGRVQVQTMVTPRKNNPVKKNLFGEPSKPPKQNLAKPNLAKPVESPETKLYEELIAKVQASELTDLFGFHEIEELFVSFKPVENFWVVDHASLRLVMRLVTFITHEIIARSMAAQGVSERSGFVLNTENFEKAIKLAFAGELSEHALTEARNAQSRYHGDSSRVASGLICDYELTTAYLETLSVVASAEVAVALTAALEYLILETWELCEGADNGDYSNVCSRDVLDGINGDTELQTTFKKAVEYHKQREAKRNVEVELVRSLVKADDGAKDLQVLALENKLRWTLPSPLSAFLKLQNGSGPFKIDDCAKITDSIEFYNSNNFIFTVLNWVPIFSHDDGDTWDCLDTVSNMVIRATLLNGGEEIVAEEFPIVTESFGQYLKLAQKTPTKFLEPTKNVLGKADPVAAQFATFWLNIVSREEDEEGRMNLD